MLEYLLKRQATLQSSGASYCHLSSPAKVNTDAQVHQIGYTDSFIL